MFAFASKWPLSLKILISVLVLAPVVWLLFFGIELFMLHHFVESDYRIEGNVIMVKKTGEFYNKEALSQLIATEAKQKALYWTLGLELLICIPAGIKWLFSNKAQSSSSSTV